MGRRERIALYGGTFDPVHVGHIAVAQSLLELFTLDGVLFIPAHVAPHKRNVPPTSALHRYAMLALATQHEARFRVSTIELDAPERPYTVDTLSQLQAKLGQRARLFFVMGADSWMEITTWREWERVLTMTDQIVMARPGYELSEAHIPPAIRERIVDLRGATPETAARALDESGSMKIYLTDATWMDISATAIRRGALGNLGDTADGGALVPPPVADYIRKYQLYREVHETEFSDAGSGSAH